MTRMRRINITHDDYKTLDSEFNAGSARNAPVGALVHSIIEQNTHLKQRVSELEALMSRVNTTNLISAKDRNAAFIALEIAVAALKRT